MSRITPLHHVHEQLGASFTEFAGWSMPVRYTSEIAEHHAVRSAAGLFDLSHMGEIEVAGPGAAALLDHALVGRLSALADGRAKYSMICAEDGGLLDDVVVYRLEDERFLVVANAGNVAVVGEALQHRADGFDATVHDASLEWALIAVQGPASVDVLDALDLPRAASMKYYSIAAVTLAGVEGLLARTGYTGEDGFEIYAPVEDADHLWRAISAAGSRAGLEPAGLACRDTLRLEAGMPLYGHELTRELTPYEAGLGRVVALDKPGGFVGQEALRVRHAEGPRTRLVGLRPQGRRSPRSGYAVLEPTSGEPVGMVTSGAPSPTLGHPIAMAYVTPRVGEPGTVLQVSLRGDRVDAEVVELPFYRRTQH